MAEEKTTATKTDKLCDVKLNQAHTHARKPYAAGETIKQIPERTAKYLVDNKIGERV